MQSAGTLFSARLPKRYQMMAMLLLALLLCYIDRVIISIAAIEMQKEFGWSDADKGLVLSSFFFGYLLMQISGGVISNRFGGRNVLVCAVVFWSLFTVLTPVVAMISLPVLVAARFLLGVGEGASFPAGYGLIHERMPPAERSRAIAAMLAAVSGGSIVALIVGGPILEAFGWPTLFYLFGGMGFLWALFWIPMVPAQAPDLGSVSAEKPEEKPEKKSMLALPWRLLLTHPAVLTLYLMTIAAASITHTLSSWLPSYYVDQFDVGAARAGFLSILPFGGYALSTILAGIYSDRRIAKNVARLRVRREVTLFCGCMIVVGLLLLVQSQGLILSVTSASFVMVGLGGMTIGYSPLPAEVLPDHGDVVFGFMGGIGSLGGALMVYLTGLIVDSTGSYSDVFYLMVAVVVLAILIFLRFAQAHAIDRSD